MWEFLFYLMAALTLLGYIAIICAGIGAIVVLIMTFRAPRRAILDDDGYGGQGGSS